MQNLSGILELFNKLKPLLTVATVAIMLFLSTFVLIKSYPLWEAINELRFDVDANASDIGDNEEYIDKLDERTIQMLQSLGRIEGALGINPNVVE